MNLIQQLQTTPKWKEFEDWYYTQMVDSNYPSLADVWLSAEESDTSYQIGALQLPFDFLKGVFEKFIIDSDLIINVEYPLHRMEYSIRRNADVYKRFNSFEQLLIWYFNN